MATFISDSRWQARFALIIRASGSLLLGDAWLIYSHGSPKWIVGLAVLWLFLVAICYGRLRWGDEVVVEPGSLIVKKQGKITSQIEASSLTSVLVRKGTLGLTWKADKRRTVVLPSESFQETTFRALSEAVVAFTPAEILRRD